MNFDWVSTPWAVVVALAAYRLTRLWIDDMLPPLPRIRHWIDQRAARWSLQYGQLVRFDERHPDANPADRDPYIDRAERRINLYQGEPAAGYLITCYWCSGFWIALASVLGVSLLPLAVWAVPTLALAFSAVTGLLAQHAK